MTAKYHIYSDEKDLLPEQMIEMLRECYVSLDCDESDADLCNRIRELLVKVQS